MIVGRVIGGNFRFLGMYTCLYIRRGDEIECYLSIQVSMLIFILI